MHWLGTFLLTFQTRKRCGEQALLAIRITLSIRTYPGQHLPCHLHATCFLRGNFVVMCVQGVFTAYKLAMRKANFSNLVPIYMASALLTYGDVKGEYNLVDWGKEP